jgi:hypothetical protein
MIRASIDLITFLLATNARNRRRLRPHTSIDLVVSGPDGRAAVTMTFGGME